MRIALAVIPALLAALVVPVGALPVAATPTAVARMSVAIIGRGRHGAVR